MSTTNRPRASAHHLRGTSASLNKDVQDLYNADAEAAENPLPKKERSSRSPMRGIRTEDTAAKSLYEAEAGAATSPVHRRAVSTAVSSPSRPSSSLFNRSSTSSSSSTAVKGLYDMDAEAAVSPKQHRRAISTAPPPSKASSLSPAERLSLKFGRKMAAETGTGAGTGTAAKDLYGQGQPAALLLCHSFCSHTHSLSCLSTCPLPLVSAARAEAATSPVHGRSTTTSTASSLLARAKGAGAGMGASLSTGFRRSGRVLTPPPPVLVPAEDARVPPSTEQSPTSGAMDALHTGGMMASSTRNSRRHSQRKGHFQRGSQRGSDFSLASAGTTGTTGTTGMDTTAAVPRRRGSGTGSRSGINPFARRGSSIGGGDSVGPQDLGGAPIAMEAGAREVYDRRRRGGVAGGSLSSRGSISEAGDQAAADEAVRARLGPLTDTAMKAALMMQLQLGKVFKGGSQINSDLEMVTKVVAPVGHQASAKALSRLRDASAHVVCMSVQERVQPSGSISRCAAVHHVSLLDTPRDPSEPPAIVLHGSWPLESLAQVERVEPAGSNSLVLVFQTGAAKGSAGHGHGEGGQGPVNVVRKWEAVSTTACDELLWGVLTLCKAFELQPNVVGVNDKDLDCGAVYNGFAAKHKHINELLSLGVKTAAGAVTAAAATSHAQAAKTQKGDGEMPVDWEYKEYEQGEVALERLGWKEKGREALEEELVKELDNLEGSTIEQLIVWSDDVSETQNLTAVLDQLNSQLVVMEDWLETHGKPLEKMQKDMAAIEGKNNSLELEWKNYQRLHEYLSNLVEAISLSPEREAMLRDPADKLERGYSDDTTQDAVTSIVEAASAMEDAIKATEEMGKEEGLDDLQLMSERCGSLVKLRQQFLSNLEISMPKLFHQLAADSKQQATNARSNLTGDVSSQRLLQAQRTFHGYLIDYEPLLQQVRRIDSGGSCLKALQAAYTTELAETLLKSLAQGYFGELMPRVKFSRSNPSLSSIERAKIGDLPPLLSPTSSKMTPTRGGELPVEFAVREAIEHTMPAITREYAFFATLFKMNPDKSPEDRFVMQRLLSDGMVDLKGGFKKLAAEITDVSDALSVIALTTQSRKEPAYQSQVASNVLVELRESNIAVFNKFVGDQVAWIQSVKVDAKKAGVLAPFAKFPTFADSVEAAINKGCPSLNGSQISEIADAYQRMALALFQLLETISSNNRKYSSVLRIENCYFFYQLIGERDIPCLDERVEESRASVEVHTRDYLDGLVAYQFPALTRHFFTIEERLLAVGARDVHLHESKKNLEAVLKKHADKRAIAEGMKAMHARMMKHISRESCLLPILWDKLSDMLFTMFSRFEELCLDCYDVILSPSAAEVLRAANHLGGASADREEASESGSVADSPRSSIAPSSPPSGRGGGWNMGVSTKGLTSSLHASSAVSGS
ncbi:unnamed protein product [Chrysoparadoxa australica]